MTKSAWGQSEKSGRSTGRSALLPTPDMALHRENRRFVPKGDIPGESEHVRITLASWSRPTTIGLGLDDPTVPMTTGISNSCSTERPELHYMPGRGPK